MLDLSGAEAVAEAGIEALRQRLIPADAALSAWPSMTVAEADVRRFCGGQSVPGIAVGEPGSSELVRVYGPQDQFLGIGEQTSGGFVAPRRIFRLDD